MGVHSFWEIVGPTARPVRLESLEEKKMAIDASIWIYQFLKAMRDNEGNAIKSSHVTGFFRRICKLLYFGIKPVFVFDGGVPVLKRKTIQARNDIRQGKRDSAKRTARKLLALQMHQKESERNGDYTSKNLSPKKKDKENDTHVFKPNDDWDLPEIEGFLYDRDDQRINPDYDEEKKKKLLMNATVDDIIDDMDLDSINPASKEFEELPKAVQYQILSKLRLKSRLRMGYTKEQLQNVFPNSIDFSKFQIDMVRRRNFYTQKIINVTGMNDGGASKLDDVDVKSRIAGQRDKEYKLTKTDNGWTLGLDDQAGNDINKPILLDNDDSYNTQTVIKKENEENEDSINDDDDDDDEDEDFEWEDVDLKPQDKLKDNFDYSLKAGRLPQFEESKQNIGSKAFLDTRPHFESPLKNSTMSSPVKHINIVDNYDTPVEQFHGSNLKRKIMSVEDDNDEAEDEYLQQMEEIEMMEAVQKSKMEQYEKQRRLKEEQETELKEKARLEELQKKKIETEKKLTELIPNYKPRNVGSSMGSAKQGDITPEPSTGTQDLNFILKKLPTLNNSSLLFGSQDVNDNTATTSVEMEPKEDTKKTPPPETPSWFTSRSQDISNVYGQSAFVNDKTEENENNKDNGYQLLSGFLNAEELIKENNEIHAKEDMLRNAKDLDGEDMKENVISIDDGEEEEVERKDTDYKDIIEDKKDIDNDANNKISKIAEISNHQSEKNITIDDTELSQSDMSEKGYETNTKIKSTNEPMVFNYEFLPEEEDNMMEEMRQEADDFETFKNQELLNGYQTQHDKVIDTAFIEDELYDQQTKDKRDSDEVTPEMVAEVQELLSRFGIPFINAPMEAEAQCAELLQLKLVDGIITDDSDVFLFGGTKIYKNLFQDKKYVEFYDYDSIEQRLGLSRMNMIELALLLGSDYTTGIKSMGPVSSMEVLANFGTLQKFKEWYEEGQFDTQKLKNEDKYEKDLRKKLVRNEVVLESDFPNETVVDAYMNPEVDHDKTPFQWSVPDLDMLRQFLQNRVGWSMEKTDEVLIPLIRDINKRKQQGNSRQMTLTEFFPSDFAANVNNTRTKINMGKRITNATAKLKKQKLK